MIYDLDTIPYKLFLKIAKTGDVSLLSDTETDLEKLGAIWAEMIEQHGTGSETAEKELRLKKNIDFLKFQYKIVLMCCESLRFDWHDGLVALLKSYQYTIRNTDTETYYNDIERIEREAEALKLKIASLEKLMPKSENKYTIDDVMASYCVILGINIGDFNKVTYSAFHGFERQVNAKCEALKNNQNNGK